MDKHVSLNDENRNFHNGNALKYRDLLIKRIHGGAVFGISIESGELLGRNCYFCIKPLRGEIFRLFETGPDDSCLDKAEELAYAHKSCYRRAELGELNDSPVLKLNLDSLLS